MSIGPLVVLSLLLMAWTAGVLVGGVKDDVTALN